MSSRRGPRDTLIPAVAIGALVLAGGLVLAHLTRGSTFYADEWDWILHRRHGGLGSFLTPHEEHLSLVPLVVYRLLFATVGIRHYWPYLAVTIAAQLAVTTLVFAYGRPRVGSMFALGAAALVLFFGPGSIDFLWAFQMAWLFAVAAGIGGLLALDRRDRLGDALVCLLMAIALASAGPGLAVALGLTVEVVWTRGRRALWIAGGPLGLYALWWVTDQQAGILRETFLHILTFMANAAAAAVTSLTGLLALDPTSDSTTFHVWGPTVLFIALAALGWRMRVLWPVAPRVWALLVMTLAFWLITGLGRGAFRAGPLVLSETGDEGRYIYVGAVLVLVLVLELTGGLRLVGPVAALVVAGLLGAIVSNFGALRLQALYLRGSGAQTAAYVGTVDMTRAIVAPTFPSAGFLLGVVQAQQYFAAERDLGTPALSPQALAGADDGVRELADRQLIVIHALGLSAAGRNTALGPAPAVDPGGAAATPAGPSCVAWRAPLLAGATPPGLALTVPAAGLEIRTQGGPTTVAVRRFSTQFDALGTVAAGATATLRIARDGASEPWHLLLRPTGSATVCGLAA